MSGDAVPNAVVKQDGNLCLNMYSEAQRIQNQPVGSKNKGIYLITHINLTFCLSASCLYPGIWVADTKICIIDRETALQYDHDTAEGPIKLVLLYSCTQVTIPGKPKKGWQLPRGMEPFGFIMGVCVPINCQNHGSGATAGTGKLNISLTSTTLLHQQPHLLPINLLPTILLPESIKSYLHKLLKLELCN